MRVLKVRQQLEHTENEDVCVLTDSFPNSHWPEWMNGWSFTLNLLRLKLEFRVKLFKARVCLHVTVRLTWLVFVSESLLLFHILVNSVVLHTHTHTQQQENKKEEEKHGRQILSAPRSLRVFFFLLSFHSSLPIAASEELLLERHQRRASHFADDHERRRRI